MRPVILHVEKKIALLEFIMYCTYLTYLHSFIIHHHSPDDLSRMCLTLTTDIFIKILAFFCAPPLKSVKIKDPKL